MRRTPLSKGEWLLITLPIVAFGIFAAWQTAVRLKAPSLLQSAPVPVTAVVYGGNGAQIFGFGTPRDAQGNVQRSSFPVFLAWDEQSGDLKRQNTETRPVGRWAVSPNGRFLATGDGSSVFVRDLNQNLEVAHFNVDYGQLAWTPDNQNVIVYGSKLQFFSVQSGGLQRAVDVGALLPDASFIQFCRFSRDKQQIALVENPGSLRVKNSSGSGSEGGYIKGRVIVATWPKLKKIAVLPGELCFDVVFSSDGTKVTAAHTINGGYQTLGVVLAETDLRTKRTHWTELEKTPRSSNILFDARFSPDGRLLATEDRGGFDLWGTADGKFLGEIPALPKQQSSFSYQMRPRFSPNGHFLIRPNGNEVERFDLTRFLPLEKSP